MKENEELRNRKKILDFLETGKGKQDIEERLHDSSFREEYLELTRMEAALYQAWEEKSTMKLKKKPLRFPVFRVSALVALLALAFIAYTHFFQNVAIYASSSAGIKANTEITLSESTEINLKDGSRIFFKGQSKFRFIDENTIEVFDGFLEAKVNPRPKNKLSILTPSGPFTVIGTQFTLMISEDLSFLNVTEGKVAVADKVIGANEEAVLKKSGELLTSSDDLKRLSSTLLLRELSSDPSASFVSDFSVVNNKITNMVNGERTELDFGIKATENGLVFNEEGAIKVKALGEAGLEWNLSMWLKYELPYNGRKSIVSHESFVDKNMGGWNLYYFRDFIRLHTVKQPYLHDTGDTAQTSTEWFHLSINVKSLGHGKVEENFYINGELKHTHQRLMLFLKKQTDFYLGGLSKNAMSAFTGPMTVHNFYYKGEMANLVYMNSLLSEEQIKALYNSARDHLK